MQAVEGGREDEKGISFSQTRMVETKAARRYLGRK